MLVKDCLPAIEKLTHLQRPSRKAINRRLRGQTEAFRNKCKAFRSQSNIELPSVIGLEGHMHPLLPKKRQKEKAWAACLNPKLFHTRSIFDSPQKPSNKGPLSTEQGDLEATCGPRGRFLVVCIPRMPVLLLLFSYANPKTTDLFCRVGRWKGKKQKDVWPIKYFVFRILVPSSGQLLDASRRHGNCISQVGGISVGLHCDPWDERLVG